MRIGILAPYGVAPDKPSMEALREACQNRQDDDGPIEEIDLLLDSLGIMNLKQRETFLARGLVRRYIQYHTFREWLLEARIPPVSYYLLADVGLYDLFTDMLENKITSRIEDMRDVLEKAVEIIKTNGDLKRVYGNMQWYSLEEFNNLLETTLVIAEQEPSAGVVILEDDD